MKEDTEVTTWPELLTALYDIPKGKHARYRSDYVYRGVANKEWGLQTSLQRLGSKNIEVPMRRSFRKYAKPGEIPSTNLWFELAIAQHHGLPTRVLDWSVSPMVAAHFATYEEEHFDKDGAIWCVNAERVRELLPDALAKILFPRKAYVFSVEMLDGITSLEQFDEMSKENQFVVFFEPPSLDDRIINQNAIMSTMPGVELDMLEYLTRPENAGIFKRIIIPKDLKWELRDKLDQNNVTERMLFPGLDGLSRWLKRYYGPGPNKNAEEKEALPTERR